MCGRQRSLQGNRPAEERVKAGRHRRAVALSPPGAGFRRVSGVLFNDCKQQYSGFILIVKELIKPLDGFIKHFLCTERPGIICEAGEGKKNGEVPTRIPAETARSMELKHLLDPKGQAFLGVCKANPDRLRGVQAFQGAAQQVVPGIEGKQNEKRQFLMEMRENKRSSNVDKFVHKLLKWEKLLNSCRKKRAMKCPCVRPSYQWESGLISFFMRL